MQFLKIYGLERSGTNYLEWLLKNNFPDIKVLVDETGWKHGPVPEVVDWEGHDWSDPNMDIEGKKLFAEYRLERIQQWLPELKQAVEDGELKYCFIVKNPYSWYASYTKYQGVQCSPVKTSILKYWYQINKHWFEVYKAQQENAVFIRYEDLLYKPSHTFDLLAKHFRLFFDKQQFLNCYHKLSMYDGQPLAVTFDSDYYKEKRYLLDYSEADISLFKTLLPLPFLQQLAYND